MLARLNQTSGVRDSYANGSGTLLVLSLGPGAEPGKVAEGARRVLSEQVGDRVPVPLGGGEAAQALRGEEWRDHSRVAESAATQASTSVRTSWATELRTSVRRVPAGLAALLLACLAVGLGFLWRRHRRGLVGEE